MARITEKHIDTSLVAVYVEAEGFAYSLKASPDGVRFHPLGGVVTDNTAAKRQYAAALSAAKRAMKRILAKSPAPFGVDLEAIDLQ